MPVAPVPPVLPQPIVTLNLIKSAMLEINILRGEGNPSGADAAWGLEKLQRLCDKLNAIRQAIFSVSFTLFNLQANHAPHTIGPNFWNPADFDTTPSSRPVRIQSASFILNSGANAVDMPIHIRDDEWWAANPVKSLTSSIVTDLYYDPAMPLGNCNFWPICNIVNPVRLEMWNSLTVPLTTAVLLTFPQGYWDAIVLTLAVEMCSSFGKEPQPSLVERQREAMRIIFANNAQPPRIDTDFGMPSSGRGGRPDFNFLTGLRE